MWVPKGGGAAGRVLLAAMSLAGVLCIGDSEPVAQTARREWPPVSEPDHRAHMVIPPNTRFPITRKITIGLDKSMLIELPVDLQNVLVSNPDVVDAVVQSSRQVYLLAKDVGDANAFFMGADGQRLVFLEVSVTRDLTPLNDALNRHSARRAHQGGSRRRQRRADRQRHQSHRRRPAPTISPPATPRRRTASSTCSASPPRSRCCCACRWRRCSATPSGGSAINIPGAVLNSGNISFAKVLQNAFPGDGSIVPPAIALAPGCSAARRRGRCAAGNLEDRKQLGDGDGAGARARRAHPHAGGAESDGHLGRDRQVPRRRQVSRFPSSPTAAASARSRSSGKQFGVQVEFKPVVHDGRPHQPEDRGGRERAVVGRCHQHRRFFHPRPQGAPRRDHAGAAERRHARHGGAAVGRNAPKRGRSCRASRTSTSSARCSAATTTAVARANWSFSSRPTWPTHAPRSEFARPDGGYAPSSTLKELLFGHLNRIYGPPGYRPHGRYEGDVGFIVDYPDSGVKP